MRSRVLFVCCLALSVFIAGTIVAQEDRYFIESKAFENRQRPGVEFNHLLHYEILECTDCHHDYVDGENIWDMYSGKNYCSDCHTVSGEDDTGMGLMQAFHEQCVGCHQETFKQGKNTGYIMCGECHVRP
jgi:hypothetical protein